MSDIAIVSGTRRAIKERVDGTLVVSVEIDPRFKSDFLRLFPNIDTPCALAPLVADFEQRAPEPEKVKGGEYGKHYEVLFKGGFFHNPKVVTVTGVPRDMEPTKRVEAIKSILYEAFSVTSLAEIPPAEFYEYWRELGITLPPAFGAA